MSCSSSLLHINPFSCKLFFTNSENELLESSDPSLEIRELRESLIFLDAFLDNLRVPVGGVNVAPCGALDVRNKDVCGRLEAAGLFGAADLDGTLRRFLEFVTRFVYQLKRIYDVY